MRPRPLLVAALCLLLVTCEDSEEPTEPTTELQPPVAAISDGAHGGNPHFYFLRPMVPEPSYTGTFDASKMPAVVICEWTGTDCAIPLITVFTTTTGPGSETVRVVPEDEHYIVNWHTDHFALDDERTYRITVVADGQQLGFADVDLANDGKELKNLDTGEYVPLLDGRTLPIKFRIEEGAVVPGPPQITPTLDESRSVSSHIGRDGGQITVTAADGTHSTLTVPENSLLEDVTITLTPVTSIVGLPLIAGNLVVAVQMAPEGLLFMRPAILEIELPSAIAPEYTVGFGYHGTGEGLHLELVEIDGSMVSFQVFSFSGKLVAEGIATACLTESGFTVTTDMTQDVATEIIGCILSKAGGDPDNLWEEDIETISAILRMWFEDNVLPGIQAAQDLDQLVKAAIAFWSWVAAIELVEQFGADSPDDLKDIAESEFYATVEEFIANTEEACQDASNLEAKKPYLQELIRIQVFIENWPDELLGLFTEIPTELCGKAFTVADVQINPPHATLAVGETETLTATLLNNEGVTLEGPEYTVDWSTSDRNVATVDMGSVLGEAVGSATISATSRNAFTPDGGIESTAQITVTGCEGEDCGGGTTLGQVGPGATYGTLTYPDGVESLLCSEEEEPIHLIGFGTGTPQPSSLAGSGVPSTSTLSWSDVNITREAFTLNGEPLTTSMTRPGTYFFSEEGISPGEVQAMELGGIFSPGHSAGASTYVARLTFEYPATSGSSSAAGMAVSSGTTRSDVFEFECHRPDDPIPQIDAVPPYKIHIGHLGSGGDINPGIPITVSHFAIDNMGYNSVTDLAGNYVFPTNSVLTSGVVAFWLVRVFPPCPRVLISTVSGDLKGCGVGGPFLFLSPTSGGGSTTFPAPSTPGQFCFSGQAVDGWGNFTDYFADFYCYNIVIPEEGSD